MKKSLLCTAFVLGALTLGNAQKLQITNYDNNTVEYGNVEKGSDGSRVIKIQNAGDKPLVISNIQSSCGCTVPKWTTEPIAPGKKGEITVTYNTASVGRFSKVITISSNDVENPTLSVRVQGTVDAPEVAAVSAEKK
ncbi:MAG: DUF1573 domain-containing protein [Flavobacteriaceae bacterium]|jgi:hypothetical protein|nr:DUF1573 domain-containing protein [Flavobacteriaceae bacterium]